MKIFRSARANKFAFVNFLLLAPSLFLGSRTFLASATAQTCTGANYVVPDDLRCTHVNVAAALNGGSCVGSSTSPVSCSKAVDGRAESPSTSYEWYAPGGVGLWLKIQFAREFTINTFRVMQRGGSGEQFNKLRLEFSDGSQTKVSLKRNSGDSASPKMWEVKSIPKVSTSWVNITAETVYSSTNNGYKEIEFYNKICLKDKLCDKITVPVGGTSELQPLYGRTVSLLLKSAGLKVILHADSSSSAKKYKFSIGGSCSFHRFDGSTDTQVVAPVSRSGVVSSDGWRSVWIDFRSDNLVLGSGAKVLFQWKDNAAFDVGYITFEGTTASEVVLCHREEKCYKDADHFWPLDKAEGGIVHDLRGKKTGQTNISFSSFELGPQVDNMYSTSLLIDTSGSKTDYINLGDFSSDCISDPDRCLGLTVSFWLLIPSSITTNVTLLHSRETSDPGLYVGYAQTQEVVCKIYCSTVVYAVTVSGITKNKLYHFAIVWEKSHGMKLLINGLESKEGTLEALSSPVDNITYLMAGRTSAEKGSFCMSNLAIWKRALSFSDIQQRLKCSRVGNDRGSCSPDSKIACGWSGITADLCAKMGCCYNGSVCYRRDKQGIEATSAAMTGSVVDSQLTATSSENSNSLPNEARLNKEGNSVLPGKSWSPRPRDRNPYLQIDTAQVRVISKVLLQGSGVSGINNFVKTFALSYSTACASYYKYKENNVEKVFTGNTGPTGFATVTLPAAIMARCIRIHPRTWSGKIALKVELIANSKASNYQGCYKSGTFVSAGDYDYTALTTAKCVRICGRAGKAYAALKNGVQCFCADAIQAAYAVSFSRCNTPCGGNMVLKCGGDDYYSVYQATGSFNFPFQCSVPNNITSLTNFVTTCTSYNSTTKFNYGESLPVVSENGSSSYRYHSVPGKFFVHAYSSAGDYGEADALTWKGKTEVYDNPVGEHGCPKIVEANKEFYCDVTLFQGTHMRIQGQLTGGSAIDAELCEVHGMAAGQVFSSPAVGTGEPEVNATDVLPDSRISEDGQLVGLGAVVERGGCFTLQVLRPVCGRGATNQHCFLSGLCETQPVSCSYTKNCTTGQTFATDSGLCVINNTITADTNITALFHRYEIVGQNHVCVAQAGHHSIYFKRSNFTDVRSGDIISLFSPPTGSTKITTRVSPTSSTRGRTQVLRYSNTFFTLGSLVTKAAGKAIYVQYSFQAFYRVKCKFRLQHKYPIGVYHETVKVKTPSTEVVFKPYIIATESIDGINLTHVAAVVTNASFDIRIHPHLGYNITYNIKYGSPSEQTKFATNAKQDTVFTSIYNQTGSKNIVLVASNALSYIRKICSIIVQNAVVGLSFKTPIPPIPCKNITKACFFLKGGSAVKITANFGDGYTATNGSLDISGTLVGCFSHTYSSVGEYRFTLNASNLATNQSIEQLIIVECPIKGLAFEVVHVARDIEVNETICINISITEGTNVAYTVYWGDEAITETTDLKPCHNYTTYRFNNITVSAYNNVSRANLTHEIQVHKPVFRLVGFNVTCPPTNHTNPTPCKLNIDGGTDFVCVWSYGDGSTSDMAWRDLGNTTNHTYASVGLYSTCANCTNRLYNTVNCTTAIVEEPIFNFSLPNSGNRPRDQPLSQAIGVTKGTNVNYTLTVANVGNGALVAYTPTFNADKTSGVATITFTSPGVFRMSATAVNHVTELQTINIDFLVDQIILGATGARVTDEYTKVHSTSRFDIRITQGSNVTCYWQYGDGVQEQLFHPENFTGVVKPHRFDTAGDYTVKTVCNNSVSSVKFTFSCKVQNPHRDVYIICNSPGPLPPGVVSCTIAVRAGTLPPTNSTCIINDGNYKHWTKPFNPPLVHNVVYTKNGSYDITINCTNEISNVSMLTAVEVQTPVKDFTVNSRNTGGDYPKDSPGRGADKSYFPQEYPIRFYPVISNGTNVTYTCSFGDGSSISTMQLSFNHSYSGVGVYPLSCTAENAINRKLFSTAINIYQSVDGVTSSNDGPKKIGRPITFRITGTQIGTDSCFSVDTGNGTSFLYKTKATTVCQPSCSNGGTVRLFSALPIIFQHVYPAINRYSVTVIGCNVISTRTAKGMKEAVTSPKPCKYPEVNVTEGEANKNETHPIEYQRSKHISVSANTKINCEATQEAIKQWKVYRCNDNSQNCTLYKLPSSVPVTLRTIVIEKRSLPYANYKFEYTIYMVGVAGIETTDYGLLKVVKTPLVCSLTGGSSKSVGYSKNITTDALNCYDPDNGEGYFDGMLLDWFCSEVTENFTVWDNSSSLPGLPVTVHPDVFFTGNQSSNSTNSTLKGGCLGYGPGRLVTRDRDITINTRATKIGHFYLLQALVKKDSRKILAQMIIEIVAGDPPDLSIEIVGHAIKLNPSDRFALRVIVKCAVCGKVSFQWTLYYLEKDGMEWLKKENLQEISSTGVEAQNLVVKPETLEGKYQYKFRLDATASMSGTRGYTEKRVDGNLPPHSGRCGVFPTSGYDDTKFTLYCENWEDSEAPLSFTYLLKDKTEGTSSTLASFKGDPQKVTERLSKTVGILPGKEVYGFNQTIVMKICDKLKCCVEVQLTCNVKRKERSAAETSALLENSLSPGGELTRLASEGDPIQLGNALLLLIDVASTMAPASGSSNTDQAALEKKAKSAQVFILKMAIHMEVTSSEAATTQLAVLSGGLRGSGDAASDQVADVYNAVAKATSFLTEVAPSQKDDYAMSLVNVIGKANDASNTKPADEQEDAPTESSYVPTTAPVSKSPEQIRKEKEKKENETKQMVGMVSNIQSMLLYEMVAPEPANVIKSESLSLAVKKDTKDTLSAIDASGGSFSGLGDAVSGDAVGDKPISSKASKYDTNPFSFVEGSENVQGAVSSLQLSDTNGKEIKVTNASKPIDIRIQQKGFKSKITKQRLSPGACNCHTLTVGNNLSSIFIKVIPNLKTEQLHLYLIRDSCSIDNYMFNFSTPLYGGNVTSTNNLTSKETDTISPYMMFVTNDELNATAAGDWKLAVCHTGTSDCCEQPLNYTLDMFTAGCYFINETSQKFETKGCKVGPLTTPKETQCLCTHLTSFAGDFVVPPNKIDWSKISLDELLKNMTVFSVVLGIFGLYCLLVIWARRADKKDLEKVGLTPLADNDPRDTYLYEIVVYTGHNSASGTTSEIRMVLSGGLDEISPRLLKDPDPNRRKFCKGNVDYFLLAVPRSLGKLKQLRMWHNNSGSSPSWFLLRVMVHDLQSDTKTWFINDRWLAVEEDDGMVERTLVPATKAELTSFNLLFSTEARKNLSDGHLWFSVVARPAKSNFTRVQRLSCCLSILLCTMLANAMFYQVDDKSSSGTSVHVGPFSFSIKQVSIGITSSLVVLPVNIIIVTLFRKIRPPDPKKKLLDKGQDPNNQSPKYEAEEALPEKEKTEDENDSDDENKDAKKKKKKKAMMLSPKFAYVAYALVFIASIVSATFTIFYGLTFGKEKSEGWISTMMISFWQDVLISQPLKVFAAAMFFALVIKDPNKTEDENEQQNNELTHDEELIHSNVLNSEGEKTLRKLGFVDKPPNPEKLEAARQLKLKQKEMKSIIHEIIQYFSFLIIVLVIAYGNRDPMAYGVTRAMESVFSRSEYTGMDSFDSSTNPTSYWKWVTQSFIVTLKPQFWYGPVVSFNSSIAELEVVKSRTIVKLKHGGKVKRWKTVKGNYVKDPSVLYEYKEGFVADHESAYLVGSPRLRQLRVKRGQCKLLPFMKNMFSECNSDYDWDLEDKANYHPGWKPFTPNDTTDTKTKSPWHYRSAWELKGTPYWGQFVSYWGGGYVADFGSKRKEAEAMANKLLNEGWIDKYTRAIFAEFTIYNAYTNFFSVVTLLTEVLSTGGYYHMPKVQTLRLYRYIGPEMVFVMACEIMYIAFLLYFLYKQVKKYRRERGDYLKDYWNYLEILVLSFSISAIGLYFARLGMTTYTLKNMQRTPDSFVSFQYVAFLDEWVSATCSLAVFFSFLKFLRLLRFNRKMSLLTQTLKTAAAPLMYFFLYFGIIFMAYAQFGYCVFGLSDENYATFHRTLCTLFGMTLGDFDFEALSQANRLFGPLFFFSYVLLVMFILMNVFLSIIVETFNEVNNDVAKQGNDHEILSFMLHTVKANIGKQVGPAIKPTYVEPKTPMELNLDDIEEISENVQYAFRNICMEDIRQTNWFEPETSNRKKKMVMKMLMEADENFTENDICDSIPVLDELISKNSEEELIRMMFTYREKRKMEENVLNSSDESSSEDGDSDDDLDSDGDGSIENKNSDCEQEIRVHTSHLDEAYMDAILVSSRRPSRADGNDKAIKEVYGSSDL